MNTIYLQIMRFESCVCVVSPVVDEAGRDEDRLQVLLVVGRDTEVVQGVTLSLIRDLKISNISILDLGI